MTVKRKDFQKAAAFIHEFLLKLNEDAECAELRDTLNLALLHMQKYYRILQFRTQEKNVQQTLSLTARGLSPLTPFVDAPDKFQWRWINLDSTRISASMPVDDNVNFVVLPVIIQATKQGEIKYMLQLIQSDPNTVDERDGLGRSALVYACHFNQLDALKILLQNQADANGSAHDGSTALHQTCHDSNSMALHILLEFGGDLSLQDTQGRAPIHWAVTTPSLDCLRLLLQYGAEVNVKDKDGLTASMWACRLDHIKHFELLSTADLQQGHTPEGIERDNSGRTWMHWAIRRSDPLECLQTLLTAETGKLQDDEGKTVLLVAAEQGSLGACKIILEIAGPERLHDRDDQERTPLHLATIGGHGDVLNFLLDKGADLNCADKYNASPWDYARNRQLHYCQLILMSHQRQRIESNPSTPNGLNLLDNQRYINGDMEDENDNYMHAFKNKSDFKPITPPHPPKRPRTSSRTPLTRRANSLNMPASPDVNASDDREVSSAGNERKKGRIEVTVQPRRTMDNAFNPHSRREVSMSIDDNFYHEMYGAEDDVEEVMGAGMDVSDIDDDDDDNRRPGMPSPRPRPMARMAPHPPFIPQPPSLQNRLPAPPSYTDPLQPHYQLASQDYSDSPDDATMKPQPLLRHHIPASPQRAGLTPLSRPPLTRAPNAHSNSPLMPSPPSGPPVPAPRAPPSTVPRIDSPNRPSSGSSVNEKDRPGSGGQTSGETRAKLSPPPQRTQPPGVLEGKQIPPPMLTPLRNAPKPPPIERAGDRKKKKKKKREGFGRAVPLESIPPPPLPGYGLQFNPPPPPTASTRTRVPSGVVPPQPQQSKNLPQRHDQKSVAEENGFEENPPMVSGHSYPIRNVPPRERSARPQEMRQRAGQQMDAEENMEGQPAVESFNQLSIPEEEEEAVGPLIPPPQAFRGPSGHANRRAVTQSIPQEGRSVRVAPPSAKPPLPRGRSAVNGTSNGQSGGFRRPRPRPPTSKSGNF